MGNLTYSPVLVFIIVFYVIYYACTVLRISCLADYVLSTLYVIGQLSLIPIVTKLYNAQDCRYYFSHHYLYFYNFKVI